MSNVWVCADLHLGHKAITKYRTQFSTAEEHHLTILDNVLTCVGKRDKIFLLGDIVFKGGEEYAETLRRLAANTVLVRPFAVVAVVALAVLFHVIAPVDALKEPCVIHAVLAPLRCFIRLFPVSTHHMPATEYPLAPGSVLPYCILDIAGNIAFSWSNTCWPVPLLNTIVLLAMLSPLYSYE